MDTWLLVVLVLWLLVFFESVLSLLKDEVKHLKEICNTLQEIQKELRRQR